MRFADIVAICVGVSAIIGLAILLWRVGAAIVAMVRKVGRVVDDLLGEEKRPELPEDQRRRGVIELVRIMLPRLEEQGQQIERLSFRVGTLEAQLRPIGKSERPTVEATGPLNAERSYQEESEVTRMGFTPRPA